jgi:hypothetical protein
MPGLVHICSWHARSRDPRCGMWQDVYGRDKPDRPGQDDKRLRAAIYVPPHFIPGQPCLCARMTNKNLLLHDSFRVALLETFRFWAG